MTPKIKICGLTRAQDIDTANALALDYIGFVFAPRSRRYVPPEKAAILKARLAPGILAVGVFVNEAPERVAALLAAGVIDIAQLHGQEDEAYIAALRRLTAAPLWQAFKVQTLADLARANASPADLVLLDHGAGGTGQAFDWALLAGAERPYLLAGGLTPQNAAAAARLHPWGLDASTGCETNGVKDPEKMKAFVQAVRSAES